MHSKKNHILRPRTIVLMALATFVGYALLLRSLSGAGAMTAGYILLVALAPEVASLIPGVGWAILLLELIVWITPRLSG